MCNVQFQVISVYVCVCDSMLRQMFQLSKMINLLVAQTQQNKLHISDMCMHVQLMFFASNWYREEKLTFQK